MSYKIIISGGGTGGHIFPAIAIANALKSKHPNIQFLFVGAHGKMEMQKVPKAGFEIKGLYISGFHRNIKDFRNLMFPFKLLHSLFKSLVVLLKFKPDVVVGTGGYASGPLLFVASKMGVPALIQEQNSFPGITNKLLSKTVQKVCVSYPKMDRFFDPKKLLLLGNPIRKEISNSHISSDEAYAHFKLEKNKKTILVVGGSLGAKTINESVRHMVNKISKKGYQLLWQTGQAYANLAEQICRQYKGINTMPFIARMDYAFHVADVVVSRAGASSISELCYLAKPSILIPSPNVAEDHQTKNASALCDQKAALMVSDKNASSELEDVLFDLLEDEKVQEILSNNIKKLAMPDAATNIADEVIKLIKK